MKKLIIHAGTHKTGTSSIQRFLFENRVKLQKIGYKYFCVSPDGYEPPTGNMSSWILVDGEREKLSAFVLPGLAKKLYEESLGTTIISAEGFSWIRQPKILAGFTNELKQYFGEIKVVFYIRRQDMLAVSHYQQGSKYLNSPASKFYGNSPVALPPYQEYFNSYYSYFEKIGMWGSLLGEENMVIRVFEKELLFGNSVIHDFLNQFGIGIEPYDVRLNESTGREMTLISHMMTELRISPARQKLVKEYLNNGEKLLPSVSEAREFYEHFRESNIRLNSHYKISGKVDLFHDDFSMYPEVGNDKWTHETAISAISHILKGVKEMVSCDDEMVDLLRDTAIQMESVNLNASYKLMKAAHKLRPSGPLIQKKLEQYTQMLGK